MAKGTLSGAVVVCVGSLVASILGGPRVTVVAAGQPSDAVDFADGRGDLRTMAAAVDSDQGAAHRHMDPTEFPLDNPFFQDLGTNGRRCVTCHDPADGWSVTPLHLQLRFLATGGLDPVFSPNDGSNCEAALAQSPAARRRAYSMLLSRGLFRVGISLPADAEFVVDSVADPFHCTVLGTDLSLYRRPLPSTNLRFLSSVMWDGRESAATGTLVDALTHQANDATRGHAQSTRDLTAAELTQIVAFETGLVTAQERDHAAGSLHGAGAHGGPGALAKAPFFIGINDPVGLNPNGEAFEPNAFTVFAAWLGSGRAFDARTAARQSIARGERIFNSKSFTISGVGGLNGATFASGVTLPASFTGTCTVCHDTPNVGNHSVSAPLNLGISDPARAPYLPVYTLRNTTTGDTTRTTDPGRAIVTGKWDDIGKFKGPILRGLAARAPYFHNGSASTIDDVVDFYDQRFGIGLTRREKADLVAFLGAL